MIRLYSAVNLKSTLYCRFLVDLIFTIIYLLLLSEFNVFYNNNPFPLEIWGSYTYLSRQKNHENLQKRLDRLSIEYIVLKVKLTRSSLQLVSRGRQWSQSSCVAPSITNNDPGNSGKRMKFGGPFFFLNSNTRTAPRDTEATGGFLRNVNNLNCCSLLMESPICS